MKRHSKLARQKQKWQGPVVAIGITGALAVAIAACSQKGGSTNPTMVAPPNNFNPTQATFLSSTNQAPNSPYVYDGGSGGHAAFLMGRGYFPIYGYPSYYYRPAPGSTVELVSGRTSGYVAGSPGEARATAARGGFGAHGGGFGGGGG
jgi:hypothetical protein